MIGPTVVQDRPKISSRLSLVSSPNIDGFYIGRIYIFHVATR